jgi:AcrR family transcriptional regulator
MTIDVMKSVELTRREQIIAVAARIFKDNGYAGASMRTIADAVGIEASSLYNHIHSKQDILATICFNIGNDYIQGLDSLLSAPSELPS